MPPDLSQTHYVAESAEIEDSKIGDGCKVFRMARLRGSELMRGASVGDLSRVDESVLHPHARIDRFNHIARSVIGRRSYTGSNTVILHAEVGHFTSVAWGVSIGGAEHDVGRLTTHAFLYNKWDELRGSASPAYDRFAQPCNVGSDVWIGANATVQRGVAIGHGAVVGANALVSKDVPAYAIVVGVPASVVRFRFDEEIRTLLLTSRWWELPDDWIKENYGLFSGRVDLSAAQQILMSAKKAQL